jgi:hypothetical protein
MRILKRTWAAILRDLNHRTINLIKAFAKDLRIEYDSIVSGCCNAAIAKFFMPYNKASVWSSFILPMMPRGASLPTTAGPLAHI